ncbi:MAG: DUF2721 domain-containing protein [Alphaproteobacteria bacterium]|nr:DUF2721 domain-containing protein [Alphaproteobacteria bacterium]
MPDPATPFDIARIIQLSVTPVFLLVAIGSLLNIVTVRLGRIIDRARKLEEDASSLKTPARIAELHALDRRISHANRAINLCIIAALLIAFVVALLFIGYLARIDMAGPSAVLFIIAMTAIIGGLWSFLLEISISTKTIRVNSELLVTRSEDGDGGDDAGGER